MKIQTYFDVINGKKEIFQKAKFQGLIDKLKDGRYLYIVERVENIRSLEQNNTYWGIAYAYMERALVEAGYLDGTIHPKILLKKTHEWCLRHFSPPEFVERIREEWEKDPGIADIDGVMFKEPFRISSTLMTRIEGARYFELMQDGYKEFFSKGENDFIPNPDPTKSKKIKLKEE
jgi:hypothetical protein